MNWKNWKVGLFVATLSGVFTGLLGVGVGMTWKQVLILVGLNVAKDGLLYLQQHPADTISFDTNRFKKTEADGSSIESISRTTTISAGNQTTADMGKTKDAPVPPVV